MPVPKTHYLAEAKGIGHHQHIIGPVQLLSESTGLPQRGAGDQKRRAQTLYEPSLKDGFCCMHFDVNLALSRKANTTCRSRKCRMAVHHRRKRGEAMQGTAKSLSESQAYLTSITKPQRPARRRNKR